MGYLLKDIARVIEPQKISLAHTPNFARFENKGLIALNKPIVARFKIEKTDFFRVGLHTNELLEAEVRANTRIEFKELKTGVEHLFRGTYDEESVNNTTFFVVREDSFLKGSKTALTEAEAFSLTARNIRACLLKDPFVRNNFNINIPTHYVDNNGSMSEGCEIELASKGCGLQYSLSFSYFFEPYIPALKFESVNVDSIDFGTGDYHIELDVYTDTDVFLGENDSPPLDGRLGTYLASLSKAYFDKHVSFDLNALMSRKCGFKTNFLVEKSWTDAGTSANYRFVAKRTNGANDEPFFYSDVFFVVNGYDYPLNGSNLDAYVFDPHKKNSIQPLSNRLVSSHVKGQKHYFNFILQDALRGLAAPTADALVGLMYKFKTQSGSYISQQTAFEQTEDCFGLMNVVEMDLDTAIAKAQQTAGGKTIGRVEVMLSCNGIEVSQPFVFHVQPDGMFTLNDFAFLNRLGGWDSFNFGETSSVEFKTSVESAFKPLPSDFKTYSQIESISHKIVSEQKIVKSATIDRPTIEWLRELSASPAVYELSTNRYVIIDDLTLRYNSKDDLFQAEMKYHYSDTYNGRFNVK